MQTLSDAELKALIELACRDTKPHPWGYGQDSRGLWGHMVSPEDVKAMAEELLAARAAINELANLQIAFHWRGSIYDPKLGSNRTIQEETTDFLNPAVEFLKKYPAKNESK